MKLFLLPKSLAYEMRYFLCTICEQQLECGKIDFFTLVGEKIPYWEIFEEFLFTSRVSVGNKISLVGGRRREEVRGIVANGGRIKL